MALCSSTAPVRAMPQDKGTAWCCAGGGQGAEFSKSPWGAILGSSGMHSLPKQGTHLPAGAARALGCCLGSLQNRRGTKRNVSDQKGPGQKGQAQAEGKGWDWLVNSY